ncbi:MAG: prepilin-type N-terminal cleavage/methylation domain-containing protein [Luteolibacter sp.]
MKSKSGMTLLELTVVILVLLSLISILFVGARAWKKGSDRSANILNVRNVQQAVRGHQNTRGLSTSDTVTLTEIFGTLGYLKEPKPPVVAVGIDTTYSYETKYPEVGTLFIKNPDIGGDAATGEYFYTTAERTAGKVSDW